MHAAVITHKALTKSNASKRNIRPASCCTAWFAAARPAQVLVMAVGSTGVDLSQPNVSPPWASNITALAPFCANWFNLETLDDYRLFLQQARGGAGACRMTRDGTPAGASAAAS